MTSITVVTPWLNHMELADKYWQAMSVADVQVLVIDNGSEPPLPNGVRLDHNTGFSHACNVGLELAQTDAVLFLNNDVVATAVDWVEPIREALEPGVLVGPVIRYDEHGMVDGHQLPYMDGWCLAGMRDDLLELGGWDEEYEEPSYFGDNDLSFRARLAGMSLREVRVPLIHLASQTSGGEKNPDVMETCRRNHQRFVSVVREALEPVGV